MQNIENTVQTPTYNLKKANWVKFRNTITNKLAEMDRKLVWEPNIASIEKTVATVTNIIQDSLKECVPPGKKHTSKNPWWNKKLQRLKNEVHTLRKRYSRSKLEDKEVYKRRLKTKTTEYKMELALSKQKSWEQFASENFGSNAWGFVYRLAMEKLKLPPILSSKQNMSGEVTDMPQSMEHLLNSLIPDDTRDDPIHHELRENYLVNANVENAELFTEEEVERALWEVSPKKAPGHDNIPGKALTVISDIITQDLCKIFNQCLLLGHFPKEWKHGLLHAILKSKDKDPSAPSSFRPITLLPELAKTFERAIKNKILDTIGENSIYSERQYGFRKGKHTTDAISHLLEVIRTEPSKYTIVIFLDIKGAFDSVWWPAVFEELRKKKVPGNLTNLIRGYFHNRIVEFKTKTETIQKTATKGCPQGSVLGPLMWNLIMNPLLDTTFPAGSHIIAYADDIALAISANNRNELEAKADLCLEIIASWAKVNKLTLSNDKSEYMIFGSVMKRNPRIRLNNKQLRRSWAFKYLGVYIDPKLSFIPHVNFLCKKVKPIFQALKRTLRCVFGHPNLLSIYNGVVLPVVTYASEIWGHQADHSRIRRKLNEIQRSCLIAITRSYSTVSTEALCVVSNVIPLNLAVFERRAISLLKSDNIVQYGGVDLQPEMLRRMGNLKKMIRQQTNRKWQEEWDRTCNGRHTYAIFPNIEQRSRIIFSHSPASTQLLTDHGNFNMYLHRFGKSDIHLCEECLVEDTARHRLTECLKTERLRVLLSHLLDRNPSMLDIVLHAHEVDRQALSNIVS